METPPSGTPPPQQFAAYPRGQNLYGSAEKLQALCDGYFGLNNVFIFNIVASFAVRAGLTGAKIGEDQIWLVLGALVLAFVVAIGFATYKPNQKIAFGCNWSSSAPIVASLLMGINSAVCCGIIGYAVMQHFAMQEMKKYGVPTGFFSLKKSVVNQIIADRRALERGPLFPPSA
ncbi:MAG: hypothetical protein BGO01_00240 [Armatimonadetes bacterium 55-13]|nr:hypothetical protein [Armatimonadota bacterium]ODU53215.1 MAG: hypothetical protein ABT09_01960 [bacterium SCN 57-13]OJU63129.1 MAG: hypothetical protein BGO01_00240 [Armatimonadetes bacterium 55-13]